VYDVTGTATLNVHQFHHDVFDQQHDNYMETVQVMQEEGRTRVTFQPSTHVATAYGHRGQHRALHALTPMEFVKHLEVIHVKYPHKANEKKKTSMAESTMPHSLRRAK